MTQRRRRRKKRLRIDRLIALVILVFAVFSLVGNLFDQEEEVVIPTSTPDPRNTNDYNWSYLTEQNGRYTYDDGTYQAKTGIDVSYAQGTIDWNAVADDGIDYAIIRVGYRGYETGILHTDDRFVENITGAIEAGIPVGAYFFSSAITIEEAEEEARYTIGLIASYKISAPIAYDMEVVSDHDRYAALSYEEKTAIAAAFCNIIKRAGYDAVVYGSDYWLRDEIDTASMQDDHNFWLANYRAAPYYPYEFIMWQYTNQGIVNGIEGAVDLNLWFQH